MPVDLTNLPMTINAELDIGQSASTIGLLAGEGVCADRLGSTSIRHNLSILVDGLKAAYGKQQILYGTNYLLDDVLGSDFIATLGVRRASYGVRQPPKPPWTLWQFTQNETVDGINGKVDVNVISDLFDAAKFLH